MVSDIYTDHALYKTLDISLFMIIDQDMAAICFNALISILLFLQTQSASNIGSSGLGSKSC